MHPVQQLVKHIQIFNVAQMKVTASAKPPSSLLLPIVPAFPYRFETEDSLFTYVISTSLSFRFNDAYPPSLERRIRELIRQRFRSRLVSVYMNAVPEKMFAAISRSVNPSMAWVWSGKPKVSSEVETTATPHQEPTE